MPLNKSKGNMYPFVTHTWNTVKGKCPHGCEYCYMRRWGEQAPLHFDERELKAELGEGNFIFVGSSCDMWADKVEYDWIVDTLEHCCRYNNRYLFQSKNPDNFISWAYPTDVILGTTLESNWIYPEMSFSPLPLSRVIAMEYLSARFKTMLTIEPIMKFDLDEMVMWVKRCNPAWVNIGADSQGHNLPEPSWEKVQELIAELKKFTEVKEKRNLGRLKKAAREGD